MSKELLEDRRKALEEVFFRKESERLRSELQIRRERENRAHSLGEASGITDQDLLARLVGLGIEAETVAALSLVPLVEVAWADGKMEEQERDAILRGARASGIEAGTPSDGLLELWTRERPPAGLMASWKSYIGAMAGELSAEQRWRLEETLIGRARAVAEAAGGFLGIGRVSASEESVLEEMKRAFKD